MSNAQNIHSNAEAPAGLFDGQSGGESATPVFNSFQQEFTSGAVKDKNSVLGGILNEADYGINEVSHQADEALANVFNDHTIFKNEAPIVKEGSKEFLVIPNIFDNQNSNATDTHTANGKAAADQLFNPKKVTV